MKDGISSKVLPIGKNPCIRVFPEFAFVDMITNNEEFVDDTVLRGAVSETITRNWCIDCEEGQMLFNDADILVQEPRYAPKCLKRAYREAKKNDDLILRIDYQQFTNRWDSVGLFLDVKKEKYDDFTTHISSLTCFCGEMLCGRIEKEVNYIEGKTKYPIWLRLQVKDKCLVLSYAVVEGDWKEISRCEDVIDFTRYQYILGIYVSMAERQYYKWLFSNFINYRADVNDASVLKYTGIMRDSRHYAINPIIRFSDAYFSVLSECNIDLWNFIIANINSNRYVEFWLNEKYVPGLRAYKKLDYFHEGLVYGYDNDREILYMVSFFWGKPKCLEITKEEFYKAYLSSHQERSNRIFFLEYNPSNKPYELDVQGIISQLKSFLSGGNPTEEFKRFIGPEEGAFGLGCYDFFVKDDRGLKFFTKDFRISYMLLEHKKCMLERVKYLTSMGYIDKKEGEELLLQLADICKIAERLMMLVMKNRRTAIENLNEKIKELIGSLSELERVCYQEMLSSLVKSTKEKNC